MKGLRRLLITLGVAALILAALAGVVVLSGRSLLIIENRGATALTLSVETTHPGDFAWSGNLPAGKRLIGIPRFTASGGVVAVCHNADGINRTTGGYVTTGWPHRVDVVVTSCGAVRIYADTIP